MDYHYPVMLSEVEDYIKKQLYHQEKNGLSSIVIFDGTLGHAGHLIRIMKDMGDAIKHYIATDADPAMFKIAKDRITEELLLDPVQSQIIDNAIHFGDKITIINSSYTSLQNISQSLGVNYDVVFLDLGVNLRHFKQPERGFSIKGNGVLDMRYGTGGLTAAEILNTYTEAELVSMFVQNSEISNPTSTKLAHEIVKQRGSISRNTSEELNNLTIKLGYSARVAAIVFQALRIEVNREFDNIKDCIDKCTSCMNEGGIIMVLSYHSAEDRIIKEYFKEFKIMGMADILTKHAIPPSYKEVQRNKPSRSARLRVLRFNESICKEGL